MRDTAFEGKVAVVTGGAQGIGRAISQALARAGARVQIADIHSAAGTGLARTLESEGYIARFIPTDVGSLDSIQALCAQIEDSEGRVDILVNNAGIGGTLAIQESDLQDWDRILEVNLRGPFLCAKLASSLMPPGSAVVNIGSTRAFMSEPGTEPYTASKGGIVALTHALAISLGPNRIRVNCVSPGWIDVSNSDSDPGSAQENLSDQDHLQHPVGRVGRPEDIAQAVLFLVDGDRAGFITGTNLTVDGGMTVKMIYV